jgi:hypothetical protein
VVAVKTTRYPEGAAGVADPDAEALAVAEVVLDPGSELHADTRAKRRTVTAG